MVVREPAAPERLQFERPRGFDAGRYDRPLVDERERRGPHGDRRLRLHGGALPELVRDPPDVLHADIGFSGFSRIEGVGRCLARHPQALVRTRSGSGDDRHVCETDWGTCSYRLEDTPPDRPREAIRELVQGGAPMTPEIARRVVATFRQVPPVHAGHGSSPRELDVPRALSQDRSYKTAAVALGLSVDTVRFHIRDIHAELHVHSKSDAVAAMLRRGIV